MATIGRPPKIEIGRDDWIYYIAETYIIQLQVSNKMFQSRCFGCLLFLCFLPDFPNNWIFLSRCLLWFVSASTEFGQCPGKQQPPLVQSELRVWSVVPPKLPQHVKFQRWESGPSGGIWTDEHHQCGGLVPGWNACMYRLNYKRISVIHV